MFLNLFFALPLLLAPPILNLRWSGNDNSAVQVTVEANTPLLENCISSGLEVRYRYEFQLCRKRAAWFNACADSRLIRHSLIFDAVTESYKVIRDRHGDIEPEETSTYESKEEAWDALISVRDLPLEFLARADSRFLSAKDRYLSVKVSGICKGEYNQTLARIAYFLTLGLARVDAFNSGWIDFKL